MSEAQASTLQFDVRGATIASVQTALFSGRYTCREIVSAFIARIEAFNPTLNAIISLNPNVLVEADHIDHKLTSGGVNGKLCGVPILLKDNFDAVGMPTTAGSLSLAGCMPSQDSPTVRALRKAGAIILGKTNLQEFALEGLSISSLGGQTLNPYDLTRTPGGSSGGTGAAIAASFAVLGTGSDTVNSLRNPASANNLYSLRPTHGLISRAGVVPVSYTQDAVGVIGRCLKDVAIGTTIVASVGRDPADPATLTIPDTVLGRDYANAFHSPNQDLNLRDLRIGILHGLFDYTGNQDAEQVNQAIFRAVKAIQSSGATVIHISKPDNENACDQDLNDAFDADFLVTHLDTAKFELNHQLTSYLSSSSTGPNTMRDIFLHGKDWTVIPAQYSYMRTAVASTIKPIPLEQIPSSASSALSPVAADCDMEREYIDRLHGIVALKTRLTALFSTQKLHFLLYPQQRRFVVPVGSPKQAHRNGILAALTGHPALCIPAGFGMDEKDTSVPIGMEIMGTPWGEAELFQAVHRIEIVLDRSQALVSRKRMPTAMGLDRAVPVPDAGYDTVPQITPRGMSEREKQIYPLGKLQD